MRTILFAAFTSVVLATQIAQADTQQCYTAEPVADGLSYHTRNFITSSGTTIRFVPFTTSTGQNLSGKATVASRTVNGVSTKGLDVQKVVVRLESTSAPNSAIIRYADFGGGVNLRVNGQAVVASRFSQLHGQHFGGATVSVTETQIGTVRIGTLRLDGALPAFAVGGFNLLLIEACGRYP